MATTSNASTHLIPFRYRRTNKAYTEDLGNGVKLTLMLIPAGEFLMGSLEDDSDASANERPAHRVSVAQFLMGRYPVTQVQYEVVMGTNPSEFKGENRPVESVSWDDAQEFCQRLSQQTGKDYRLPSEAEWEYACRAGTQTPFHFGEILTPELANYGQNHQGTTEVGNFPANDWGLHDMHGNVWEWCADHWHNSYRDKPEDLKTAGNRPWLTENENAPRLLRGGSWLNGPRRCRSADRRNDSREIRFINLGFRVCCVPPRVLLGP